MRRRDRNGRPKTIHRAVVGGRFPRAGAGSHSSAILPTHGTQGNGFEGNVGPGFPLRFGNRDGDRKTVHRQAVLRDTTVVASRRRPFTRRSVRLQKKRIRRAAAHASDGSTRAAPSLPHRRDSLAPPRPERPEAAPREKREAPEKLEEETGDPDGRSRRPEPRAAPGPFRPVGLDAGRGHQAARAPAREAPRKRID